MNRHKFKDTDIEITSITLGTWVFGGELWGGREEKDCIEAVHCALDNGINCIDTAPIYGNGESETIVGQAIKGKRDKVILATKCGLIIEGEKILYDLSRESILREVEASLKRLQTDYIDIYQCHWPDPKTPLEETFSTLNELKNQGKIRHIGVSNFGAGLLRDAGSMTEILTTQDEYSLLNRDIEESLLPFARQNHIGVLAYGPLAGGILTGKYKTSPQFKKADARSFFYKFYDGEAFEKTLRFLQLLNDFKKPLNQIAINWVRQQEGVASVLVGCRNARQVQENVAAGEWKLSADELARIREWITTYA